MTEANGSAIRNKWFARSGIWITFAVFAGLVSFTFPTFQVGSYQDDALYINLAHAIARGHGYVDIPLLGNPKHTFVPPIYPVMLAPFLLLFNYDWLISVNFLPLQIISAALMGLGASFWYLTIRDRRLSIHATLLTALTLLNPLIASGAAIHTMSEAPYFFFSMGAIFVFDKWYKHGNKLLLWMGVLLTGLASMTRLVGMSLVLAVILWLLYESWRGRGISVRTWAAIVVILVLPLIVWFARNASLGAGIAGGYSGQLAPRSAATYLRTILGNLATLSLHTIPNAVVPIWGPRVESLLQNLRLGTVFVVTAASATVLVLVGLVRSLRHNRSLLADAYVLIYLGILFLTNFTCDGGARYLLCILPFLILYFLDGLYAVSSHLLATLGCQRSCLHLTPICLFTLVLYLARDAQAIIDPVRLRIPDIALGTTWLRQNAAEYELVMASGMREVYLYGQRRVVVWSDVASTADEFLAVIDEGDIDYILLRPVMISGHPFHWDDFTRNIIYATIRAHSDVFRRTYASPDGLTMVFEVCIPEDACFD